jgi:hypothetical protein
VKKWNLFLQKEEFCYVELVCPVRATSFLRQDVDAHRRFGFECVIVNGTRGGHRVWHPGSLERRWRRVVCADGKCARPSLRTQAYHRGTNDQLRCIRSSHADTSSGSAGAHAGTAGTTGTTPLRIARDIASRGSRARAPDFIGAGRSSLHQGRTIMCSLHRAASANSARARSRRFSRQPPLPQLASALLYVAEAQAGNGRR